MMSIEYYSRSLDFLESLSNDRKFRFLQIRPTNYFPHCWSAGVSK